MMNLLMLPLNDISRLAVVFLPAASANTHSLVIKTAYFVRSTIFISSRGIFFREILRALNVKYSRDKQMQFGFILGNLEIGEHVIYVILIGVNLARKTLFPRKVGSRVLRSFKKTFRELCGIVT